MLKVVYSKSGHLQTMPNPLANERGIALIVAISLLAIMSVLGAVLISSSTTEIQLSGNYRNNQESFYAADRAIEYAMQRAALTSDTVDLYQDEDSPGVLHRDQIADGNSGLEVTTVDLANADPELWDDRNSSIFIGSSPPPVGSGSDASVFQARNYRITTVGISPMGTNNPARSQLRAQVAKIVPK